MKHLLNFNESIFSSNDNEKFIKDAISAINSGNLEVKEVDNCVSRYDKSINNLFPKKQHVYQYKFNLNQKIITVKTDINDKSIEIFVHDPNLVGLKNFHNSEELKGVNNLLKKKLLKTLKSKLN